MNAVSVYFRKIVDGLWKEVPVDANEPLPVTNAAEETKLTAIAASVDGLETLGASHNTKLDTVIGHVDGVETAIASSNTKLDTIAGHVDGVEGALAGNLSVVPKMTSAGHASIQTNATGTTYNALTSQACKQLTLVNNTGVHLEVRQGGSGVALPVFDQSFYTFYGIANANELEVRRVDTSNTQVTAQYRWEA